MSYYFITNYLGWDSWILLMGYFSMIEKTYRFNTTVIYLIRVVDISLG